jgi:hypothetical protein
MSASVMVSASKPLSWFQAYYYNYGVLSLGLGFSQLVLHPQTAGAWQTLLLCGFVFVLACSAAFMRVRAPYRSQFALIGISVGMALTEYLRWKQTGHFIADGALVLLSLVMLGCLLLDKVPPLPAKAKQG